MLRNLIAWCFGKRNRTPPYLRGLSHSQLRHLLAVIDDLPDGTVLRFGEIRKIAESAPVNSQLRTA